MQQTDSMSDVQQKAERLTADLRRSLSELIGDIKWQPLADLLRQAVEATESVKTAAERAAREEINDQS